ncbi:MAG: outer membrane lipoprotein SlyB [Hydrogenophaga sp.]|jgi:outer membrane lipoprotein SlyB
MSIQSRLSVLALAVAASTSMLVPMQAHSQTRATTNAHNGATISSFGVEPLRLLRPGEELKFVLRATPGAKATLQIEGASAPVAMMETGPGQFEGSYIIRQRDQLTERTRVTANVVRNGRTVSAMLASSLQAGSPDVLAASSNAISDFQVTAPNRLRPGEEVNFVLKGLPGGQARVAIDGIDKAVPLREVSRGSYEGLYVVRRSDRLRDGLTADAYLVNSGRESTRRYQTDGNMASAQDQRGGQPLACATCGTVESVKLIEAQNSDPKNIIGTIAGGLLGGVLGNQVGGGSGKDAARIIGAIGGAYAGNRAQNNIDKNQIYRVTVRLQEGATRDFDYAEDPQVAVGTLVKVEGDLLVRQ